MRPSRTLFIGTEIRKRGLEIGNEKDKELQLEDIEASHTLGVASYILSRYIDLVIL